MISSSVKVVIDRQVAATAQVSQPSPQPTAVSSNHRGNDIGKIAQKLATPPMRSSVNKMLSPLKQMQSRWLTANTLAKVVCLGGLILGGAIAVHKFTVAPVNPTINRPQMGAFVSNTTVSNNTNNTNHHHNTTSILPMTHTHLSLQNHTFTHMKFAQPMQEAPLTRNVTSTLQEAFSKQKALPSLVSQTIEKPPVPMVEGNDTCPVPAELPTFSEQVPAYTVEQLEMLLPKISNLYHQELYETIVARRLSQADCQGALTTANTRKWLAKDALLKQIFASQNCDISIRKQVAENADLDSTKFELHLKLLNEMISSPQPNFGQMLKLIEKLTVAHQISAFLEQIVQHPLSTPDEKIEAAKMIPDSKVSQKFLNQYVEDLFAQPERDYKKLDLENIIAKSEHLPKPQKFEVYKKVLAIVTWLERNKPQS